MAIDLFNKAKDDGDREYTPRQDVMVITKDDGTADICNVINIDNDRILAKSGTLEYAVPIGDVLSYTGYRGRIFVYPSTLDNVTDCQRIAYLERTTVLRQITHFERQGDLDPVKLPMGKIMIGIGLVVLLIIILAAR